MTEARAIALEKDDPHQQTMLRPHRAPARKRQTLASVIPVMWATFAHRTRTNASIARSRQGCDLPERLPSGRSGLAASEDRQVTREAKGCWG